MCKKLLFVNNVQELTHISEKDIKDFLRNGVECRSVRNVEKAFLVMITFIPDVVFMVPTFEESEFRFLSNAKSNFKLRNLKIILLMTLDIEEVEKGRLYLPLIAGTIKIPITGEEFQKTLQSIF